MLPELEVRLRVAVSWWRPVIVSHLPGPESYVDGPLPQAYSFADLLDLRPFTLSSRNRRIYPASWVSRRAFRDVIGVEFFALSGEACLFIDGRRAICCAALHGIPGSVKVQSPVAGIRRRRDLSWRFLPLFLKS